MLIAEMPLGDVAPVCIAAIEIAKVAFADRTRLRGDGMEGRDARVLVRGGEARCVLGAERFESAWR